MIIFGKIADMYLLMFSGLATPLPKRFHKHKRYISAFLLLNINNENIKLSSSNYLHSAFSFYTFNR